MRSITDQLSIGNSTDAIQRGDSYDRVVGLGPATAATTHKHEIPDGEHDYETFAAAVDAIRAGLREDEDTLVHCQAGLSRSVAATIAALVTEEDWEYDEAYDACRAGFIHPAPALVESTRMYIDAKTG